MRHYLHYDVFTDRRFEGNQLAVFTDSAGLSDDQMQTITREMNFSECTFVRPAEQPDTDIRVRIFTPDLELPMAGHPTIGTAFALAASGVIRPGAPRIVFGLGVGPTPVELTWEGDALSFAWMDQRPPEFRAPASSEQAILTAIGLNGSARHQDWPIQEVSCGVPYTLVPLATRADVDRAEPDAAALGRLQSAFGKNFAAVYLFSAEAAGSDCTAYARMFVPGLGPTEDPATGSAAGPLGCYLAAQGIVPRTDWDRIEIAQGVRMRRPSRISVRVQGPAPDTINRVQVGGQARRVGQGTIDED
jgi:trans-2,3-dihydro-3-hydroxyanthranilate isomerase